MNTKLIAALACGAALALGACSGGGNPAGPAAPTTPDPADPAAPDGKTDPEKAFDDALAEAERDLAAARRLVDAAERAAAAAGTDAARTAAQMDIDEARDALAAAVRAAKALSAPAGDYDRIGAAAIQVDNAEAAQAADEAKLRMAEGSTGWAGSSALVIGKEILRPAPEVTLIRRDNHRNTDGTDAATLLKDDDIPAVMHEAGKIVMSDGLGSSGDRLRMRGIPITHALRNDVPGDDKQYLGYGSLPRPVLYLDPPGGGNDGTEPKLVAGLTIEPSRLVVELGGKGATGIDLRRVGSYASPWHTFTDGSRGGYDLELDFGRPSASPEGNAEHYWNAALMPSPEYLEDYSSVFKDGERVLPLGAYALRLSNHAGLDRNLEDPDDPAASAEDDVNHYLSYAAYGHMEFRYRLAEQDRVLPTQRTFPFHVGYDAFKDEEGMKTTDVADEIAKGTFKGRTMASQFAIVSNYSGGGIGAWPLLTGALYLRLRGDVELTATISGTAADNTVSGKIKNLESWDAKGYWEDYTTISGDLPLMASNITAAGSFAGVVDTTSVSTTFTEGGYKGNFYGPPASLEAAGIWYLQDGDNSFATARNLSIVGSFGAALVREDEDGNPTWGVARPAGN